MSSKVRMTTDERGETREAWTKAYKERQRKLTENQKRRRRERRMAQWMIKNG